MILALIGLVLHAGDTWSLDYSVLYQNPQEQIRTCDKERLTFETIEGPAHSLRLREKHLFLGTEVDGKLVGGAPEATAEIREGKLGGPLEGSPSDADTQRLQRVVDALQQVGASGGTVTYKGGKSLLRDGLVTFKCVSQGLDNRTFLVQYREPGIELDLTGEASVLRARGIVIKAELNGQNVSLPGGAASGTLRIAGEISNLKLKT